MVSCGICGGKVTRTHTALECTGCKASVHEGCCGLSPSVVGAILQKKAPFRCSKCKTSRRSSMSEAPPSIISINNKFEELTTLMSRSNNMLEKAMESIDDLKSEHKEFRRLVDELREDRRKADKRISDLEAQLALLQTDSKSSIVEEQLLQLQMDSDDGKQQLLLNTLEFQNIPEELAQQSHSQTVISVLKSALDVDIQADEILETQSVKMGNGKEDGNMFLVKFSNSSTKCRIVAARKKRHRQSGYKGVYLKDSQHRIYIHERLTLRRRQLLKEAKTWRKKLGFKFIWVDEGRILMRRKEGDKVFQINSFSDFTRLPEAPQID